MRVSFSISSDLAVNPGELWGAITCPTDINAEFRPLLKMTFPGGMEDVTTGWRAGVPRFRSWILLGCLIPVEFDDLVFEEVVPTRHFLERSRMLSVSLWEHKRQLDAVAGGTRLTDTVCFDPRLKLLAPAQQRLFQWVFAWRHRQLRRMYGAAEANHGA